MKSKYCEKRIYFPFNHPNSTPESKTLLTGIRETKYHDGQVYISGFFVLDSNSENSGFVYKGDILGNGDWFTLNYPSSPGITVTGTSLYGPNNGKGYNVRVVGNYTTVEAGSHALGCLYEGDLNGTGTWKTLLPPSNDQVINTIAHSTMGGLVVGNYDTDTIVGKAFIYDIKNDAYYDILHPHAISITAYGIWHNAGPHYTICGGYTSPNHTLTVAYLVDWDNDRQKLYNWRHYSYCNNPSGTFITHFNGITGDGEGGYYLTGDWLGFDFGEEKLGFFCHITQGKCEKVYWESISFPCEKITSGNSIWKRVVIGVYESLDNDSINGYITMCKN